MLINRATARALVVVAGVAFSLAVAAATVLALIALDNRAEPAPVQRTPSTEVVE